MLKRLVKMAEDYLEEKVTNAVLSISHWCSLQAPTLALNTYNAFQHLKTGRSLLVVNMGDTSFDVTISIWDDGVVEVLATDGEPYLGGESFDIQIVQHLIELYRSETGIDVLDDQQAMAQLRVEAERAKEELSSKASYEINISPFQNGSNLTTTLTCPKFEDITKDLFTKIIKAVERALKNAQRSCGCHLTKQNITDHDLSGTPIKSPEFASYSKTSSTACNLTTTVSDDMTLRAVVWSQKINARVALESQIGVLMRQLQEDPTVLGSFSPYGARIWAALEAKRKWLETSYENVTKEEYEFQKKELEFGGLFTDVDVLYSL
ncbi:ATPase with role in protein import into the ER [Rhizophlyctis rosea]|nr:ATPase with role in protein import into the ER [Rhizophlyctis rosea]